jgi:hypothetical protein
MEEQHSKTQLLNRIQKERASLETIVTQLTEEQMLQPGVEGKSSIKDILAHITTWEQHLVRRLAAASHDRVPLVYVVEPYDPDDTDAVNELIFARNRHLPLDQVLSDFHRSLQDVLQAVTALSEEYLFDPQGLAQVFGHPAELIIGSDTFHHYPEHIESIRTWLGKQGR